MTVREIQNIQEKRNFLQKVQRMDIENADQLIEMIIKLFDATGMNTGEFLRKNPNVKMTIPGLKKVLRKESSPSAHNLIEIIKALDAKLSIDADLKLLLPNTDEYD